VEEIPRFVTRALVLKDGRALAQGPVDAVCTSATFAEAFGRPCQVTRDADGRLALRMRPQ
jgi:iron complex transport system ATP-binding protein